VSSKLLAFDGHIKVWAERLSFANAFSHPYVQLGDVETTPCRFLETDGTLSLFLSPQC